MNNNSAQMSEEGTEFFNKMMEVWDEMVEASGLGKEHPLVQGLEEGRTIAQIQGLTRDELEAIYAHGFSLLNKGAYQKALTVFAKLVLIDPLESKNHYCLGVTLQLMGKHEAACEALTKFLVLDATNADGYLRIAESFLALGNREMAEGALECAEVEAQREGADPQSLVEARQKLELIRNGAQS